MRLLRTFLRNNRGGSAAEFSLLLPLFLLFLLGIIDLGRYAWAFNQAEKATQVGARWAVATTIMPGADDLTNGLARYDFIDEDTDTGEAVDPTDFPGVSCRVEGAAVTPTCSCKGACAFTVGMTGPTSTAAWNALIERMQGIYPSIAAKNVQVDYDYSGLGYAGDPAGADVAPLVTVSLRTDSASNRITFAPMFLGTLGIELPIPAASYSLTMEDGKGTDSN